MEARTPFESADGDFFKLCQKSKKGIPSPGAWPWPTKFGETLPSLISALLQPNPLKRLPMLPGGVVKLKEHSWFDALNWEEFEARSMPPPIIPQKLVIES